MSRKNSFATVFAFAVFGAAAAAFFGCTSLLGDFEVTPTSEAGIEGGSGKANGEACAAGTECSSSFCTDGVCCESACSGVCESCKIDKGKCVPVPDGQNPDNECASEPRADAGSDPPPNDDAGPGDAGEVDAAGQVNAPDGGLQTNDTLCAGACNGARACKFPGKEKDCGSKFCNTPTEAARASCDGKGRCELGLEACTSFTCENNECRKTCAEQNDCQPTHFCNTSGICQERLANGLGCSLPDQCKSGFCVIEGGGGVCCNSECTSAAFGGGITPTCKAAGSVGTCKCSGNLNCGAGSCRLFYRDSDNDKFGDRSGTVAGGTAIVGCDNAAPPAGFVTDKTDCDDGDARAFPGQTEFFADTSLGKGSNDFNCDGTVTKETPEYPGSTCQFCAEAKGTCESYPTCSSAGEQSRLSCAYYKDPICAIVGGNCFTCGYQPRGKITNTAGFTSTVACGATAPYRTCGKCTEKGGGPPLTIATTAQQRCR